MKYLSLAIMCWIIPLIRSQAWFSLQAVKEYLEFASPAKVVQSLSDTRVIAGESVLFHCRAEGNPTPEIHFRWNDHEVLHNRPGLQLKRIAADSASMRVKLEMKHNGDKIVCVARNQVGSESSASQITVYSPNETPPRGFPKLRQDPSATISQVGSTAHLHCEVTADPKASVTWIKDQFHPVDQSKSRFRLIGTGTLVIDSLLETDSGSYECVASNMVGMVYSNSGNLHVRRIQVPPTIHEMSEKVEVAPGYGANLTCRAGGFPIPMVWWSTMGTPAGPSGSGPLMMTERPLTEPRAHEATLRLTDINESNEYNCIAKNGLGLVRRNVSVLVKELPASPINLDVRPIGGTYAVLRWQQPKHPNQAIDSYTLSVERKNHPLGHLGRRQVANLYPNNLHNNITTTVLGSEMKPAEDTFYTYNLTDLTPYTEYVVSAHAVRRTAGLSLPSIPVHFRTSELAPSSPPQVLLANVVSPTTVVVSWKPPLKSNGRITGYKVYYTGRESDPISSWLIVRTSELKLHLTDLIPNETYHVKVNAYNAAGDGPMSQVLPIIMTPGEPIEPSTEALPAAPHNFRGTATDATTIQLQWIKPQMPDGAQLTSYQLRYRTTRVLDLVSLETGTDSVSRPADTIEVSPDATEYYLKSLTPSTRYHISLSGRSAYGMGVGAQIEVMTKDRLPEMPQGRNIIVRGPNTVLVTWNGPSMRQSEVSHYQLSWQCLDCQSTPDTPQIPMSNALTTQKVSHTNTAARNGQRKILANSESTEQHLYSATIGDLVPDSSYQLSVASGNSRGVGQSYFFPVIRTKKTAPLKPKNLHLVNIHKRTRPQTAQTLDPSNYPQTDFDSSYLSIELAWDAPDGLRTSQQITYQVFTTIVGPPTLLDELNQYHPDSSYERLPATIPGPDCTQGGECHTDERVHPLLRRRMLAYVTGNTFRSSENDKIGYGATYLFEVSLSNLTFSGQPAQLNVTTPIAAPSTSPLSVRLTGLSPTAVEMSWAPPPITYRNGPITGYQVRYFEVGAETQTETLAKVTASGQRQYTAKNLKEKTYYTFMVRAFTAAGPGPWSGASNIRTSVELPSPPSDIRATRINQHQIKVTWRIPTSNEPGKNGDVARHVAVQGFRLLYSSDNNPYEAGQWTSFDVGPVNMAIISHLEMHTSYVICIKSRAQDGRYGDCSQPVISRTADGLSRNEESEFSVRNLICTGEETSVKVTWQQPIRIKQLQGFKLRVGGSKRFANSAGIIRTLEFQARSVSVAYAAVHSGYTYTVSDLEPNSVYDVQLSAYYEMTVDMESNWETTSCYTQMQRPSYVPPPIAVATSAVRRQVLLQLARVSERFGKIRHYILVVSPVHLTEISTEKVDVEHTITNSRGLPSSGTRYIAAKYRQDFFDPPPRHARNFTLGGLVVFARSHQLSVAESPVKTKRKRVRRSPSQIRNGPEHQGPMDIFTSGMDAEINFDNKVLVDGQEYKAFVRACVFQTDQSTSQGPESCTSSDWSPGFGPDRELVPWDHRSRAYDYEDYENVNEAVGSESLLGSFGLNWIGSQDWVVIVIVMIAVVLVLLMCVALGCFMRRKRRTKLLNHHATADPSMKQPLMRCNEDRIQNGANLFQLASTGTDLVATNRNAHQQQATLHSGHGFTTDNRSSLATGHGSLSSSHLLPTMSPMVDAHGTLLSSVSTTTAMITGSNRLGPALSATSSPMPGSMYTMDVTPTPSGLLDLQNMLQHQQSGNLMKSSYPTGTPATDRSAQVYAGSNASAYMVGRGGTLSSQAGSNPSSLTGGHKGSLLNGMDPPMAGGLCDGLVIAQNGLTDSRTGMMSSTGDATFEMPVLSFDVKSPAMRHPIPIGCLNDHVSRLNAADNLLFAQEYESIETEKQFTWDHSNLEDNKTKNRYANVIAYDHSRVILQSIDCVPGSDYINANYIDGYKRPNAYIATQGPMPETYSDFWRMIWEQRVFIIVMMTRLEERSRIKCDPYWPTRSPEAYAGGLLTVTPVETTELAYYTIRTFNLTARGIDDECREVRHFQFTSWPDHGVPEYPIPLLLFIRRVRATLTTSFTSNTNNSTQPNLIEQGPVVVHCSAGVGRTGAFIVIDTMLERIKYEKTIDIYGCVKALRSQRNFMVQTEEQYIFIHSVLLEAIDAGNTEVSARNLMVHIKKLRNIDGNGGSGMELEFMKLQQYRLFRAKYTAAQLGCNKHKNRQPNILPYESTRVTLQPIRGVEGSDYVNASFIDSYRHRNAYIATQGPMAKTVDDFWRMVWELNSTIVVMLSKLTEGVRECCYPYWPSDRSARYQYYVVDPMVEYNMPNYTLREFKLTDARDGQSRTLRQFQFTDWPDQGIPQTCEPFIEFLGQVHKTKEQFGQEGPILVHCNNGVGRTGVFLAMSIVLERMRHEGVVDMFQTVRMLRTQRSTMVETEEQYRFSYNCALEYLSSFDHYAT